MVTEESNWKKTSACQQLRTLTHPWAARRSHTTLALFFASSKWKNKTTWHKGILIGFVLILCGMKKTEMSVELIKGAPASCWKIQVFYSFLKKRFDLVIFLERGKERGKRGGEKHLCVREISISCLSHALNWGPNPQHRHLLWSGIEPVTFWFIGWYSIHWTTPARARTIFLNSLVSPSKFFFL